jgi:hypothetical protein
MNTHAFRAFGATVHRLQRFEHPDRGREDREFDADNVIPEGRHTQ